MNICFICSNFWPHTYGGTERFLYELAKELIRAGYEVTYISYNWGASEIPLESIGEPSPLYDEKGRRRISAQIQFGIKSARKAKELKCDVYNITVPYTPTFFLPREKTVLMLFELWGKKWLEYYPPPLSHAVMTAEKILVKWPEKVITASNIVAEKVRKYRKNVKVIKLGLRLEEYLPYRSSAKTYDIAYIGRLVPYKGLYETLQVLKKLKKKSRIAIIGDGPLYTQISSFLSVYPHEVHMFRKVSEEEKRKILAQSKVYINTSRSEGFSISTLEAIMLGAYPVVYSAGGYNVATEIVNTLSYGKVFNTLEELPVILEEILLKDNVESLDPAKLQEYDIKRTAEEYIKVYKELYVSF